MATPRQRPPDINPSPPNQPGSFEWEFMRGYGSGTALRRYRSDSRDNPVDSTRASEAVRNTVLVQEQLRRMHAPPVAPWKGRKKGKRAALRTLGEMQRQTAANKVVSNARQAKEAKAGGLSVRLGNIGIRAGTIAGRTDAGSFQGQLASQIVQDWLGRQLDVSMAKLRGPGRRGSLATRPLSTRSDTNRRGALASRTPVVVAQRAAELPKSSGGTASRSAQGGAVRTVQGSTGTLKAIQSRASQGFEQLVKLQRGVQQRLSTLTDSFTSTRARAGVRAGARAQVRMREPVRELSQDALALTSLNSTGVASQVGTQTQTCKCPKSETKKRKDRKQSCRNPVISRTTEGDIRTTKVKLTCPPSRPK